MCIKKFVLKDAEEVHILLHEAGWVKVALFQDLLLWHTNPFVETALEGDLVDLMKVLHKHGVNFTCKRSTGVCNIILYF